MLSYHLHFQPDTAAAGNEKTDLRREKASAELVSALLEERGRSEEGTQTRSTERTLPHLPHHAKILKLNEFSARIALSEERRNGPFQRRCLNRTLSILV
jgi:hypothetical protein